MSNLSSSSSQQPSTPEPFHPALTKKLLAARGDAPKQRITNEAVLVTGELLRLFVKEARHRAAIEAECEKEGTTVSVMDRSASSGSSSSQNNNKGKIPIRPDHITKIAAEMLMDFS